MPDQVETLVIALQRPDGLMLLRKLFEMDSIASNAVGVLSLCFKSLKVGQGHPQKLVQVPATQAPPRRGCPQPEKDPGEANRQGFARRKARQAAKTDAAKPVPPTATATTKTANTAKPAATKAAAETAPDAENKVTFGTKATAVTKASTAGPAFEALHAREHAESKVTFDAKAAAVAKANTAVPALEAHPASLDARELAVDRPPTSRPQSKPALETPPVIVHVPQDCAEEEPAFKIETSTTHDPVDPDPAVAASDGTIHGVLVEDFLELARCMLLGDSMFWSEEAYAIGDTVRDSCVCGCAGSKRRCEHDGCICGFTWLCGECLAFGTTGDNPSCDCDAAFAERAKRSAAEQREMNAGHRDYFDLDPFDPPLFGGEDDYDEDYNDYDRY
jgi:hypothetical protein